MRQRAKSMCSLRSEVDDNDQVTFDESLINQHFVDDDWSAEENMNLIRKVFQVVPKHDNIPYNDRKEQIEWESITIENRSVEEIKEQFDKLLTRTRNFRILSEMLNEIEKDAFASLQLPEKPMSAFALFLKERSNLMKQNLIQSEPHIKGNFIRTASEVYKNLKSDEKEKYQKMADEIKKSYNDVLAKFNLESKKRKVGEPKIAKVKTKKTKIEKPKAMKRKSEPRKTEPVQSPLKLFYDHLKENGEYVTYAEARKKYSDLSKRKKLKWVLRYLEVKPDDKLNLEQYKMAIDTLSKEELSIIDDYEGRPKKLSGYNCFAKEYLEQQKKRRESGSITSAALKWKSLSQKEKDFYTEASEKLKTNYNDAMIEFLKELEPARQLFEFTGMLKKEEGRKRRKRSVNSANNSKVSLATDASYHENVSTIENKAKNTGDDVISVESDYENDTTMESKGNHLSGFDLFKSPLSQEKRKVDINVAEMTPRSKKEKRKQMTPEIDIDQSADESLNHTKKNQSVKRVSFSDSGAEQSPNLKKRKTDHAPEIDFNESECYTTPKKKGHNDTISSLEVESSLSKKKKKNKPRTSESDLEIREEGNCDDFNISTKTSSIILNRRPPSSVFKYYVKEMYEGPPRKAKQSYKQLSPEEKEDVSAKFRKHHKKYKKMLKRHLATLTQEEIIKFTKYVETLKNSGDEISDLTESDSADE